MIVSDEAPVAYPIGSLASLTNRPENRMDTGFAGDGPFAGTAYNVLEAYRPATPMPTRARRLKAVSHDAGVPAAFISPSPQPSPRVRGEGAGRADFTAPATATVPSPRKRGEGRG